MTPLRSTSALLLLLTACGQPLYEEPALDDGALFDAATPETLALAEDLGTAALVGHTHGLADFEVTRVQIDELGMAHTRVQQVLDGVPVFGGEAIAHLHPDGDLRGVTDNLVPDPDVDTSPLYDRDEAIELAVQSTVGWQAVSDEPVADLWVLRHGKADYLTWRVQLRCLGGNAPPSMPVVFVDAHRGEQVWVYDNLKTGTGTSNYYGTVSFESYLYDGDYYTEDTTRNLGTYTAGNTYASLYYVSDPDDDFTDSWMANAMDAHYAVTAVYDYYNDVHGRDGIDGSGGPGYVASLTGSGYTITMVVDYGSNYANAFWAGDYMAIGGGDGSTFTSLSTLDIIGHEMTHGVTENTAGLVYSYESGALDESIADVFGAMAERSVLGDTSGTWTVGEECMTPSIPGDAVRYMYDPTLDGVTRDHYDDRYIGHLDNGGVHDNAGIGFLAFYLVAEGGDHPTYGGTSMWGIGADDAAGIWYRALTTYLTTSSDYADAREAFLNAATDLYGSSSVEYNNVATAWSKVGVGCHVVAPGLNNMYCTADCLCGEGEGGCSSDAVCESGLTCNENTGADYGLDWWIDTCGPSASCHPSTNGQWNYCDTSCTCAEGEGHCSNDNECDDGHVCSVNSGSSYGLDWWVDVCVPDTDCHAGDNGEWNRCDTSCTCPEGEGHCSNDSECDEGLVCMENYGATYGLDWYVDVCAPDTSCHPSTNGQWNYCNTSCTCAEGEGHCSNDSECDSGLVCQVNAGGPYGLAWYVDVCVPE